jgi:2,3-bisphosphoglycerate-independent phosphoglycerate mutase
MARSIQALEDFDTFLKGFLDSFDASRSLLMIVSDHGNIEDLSIKTHTRNPVPCIVMGEKRTQVVKRMKNLTHITPVISQILLS